MQAWFGGLSWSQTLNTHMELVPVCRQHLWSPQTTALGYFPFTFALKTLDVVLVHDPLSSVKKFRTLSSQDVYCPPLPNYYRDA